MYLPPFVTTRKILTGALAFAMAVGLSASLGAFASSRTSLSEGNTVTINGFKIVCQRGGKTIRVNGRTIACKRSVPASGGGGGGG
jgi:hypothetical protein